MRSNFFLAALIVVLLSACGSKKAAFNYSEKLVAIENSLVPDITETENKVEVFFAKAEYDSVRIISTRMEDKIAAKIKEVEALPSPDAEEAENFKKAFLKYFAFMKSVYASYTKYASQTNDEARGVAFEEMMKVIDSKQDAISEVQRMQTKFAKANGFTINK